MILFVLCLLVELFLFFYVCFQIGENISVQHAFLSTIKVCIVKENNAKLCSTVIILRSFKNSKHIGRKSVQCFNLDPNFSDRSNDNLSSKFFRFFFCFFYKFFWFYKSFSFYSIILIISSSNFLSRNCSNGHKNYR